MTKTEYNEAESNNFNFGVVGDYIQGTLIEVNQTSKPDNYGNLSHIYIVKAEEGNFHGSTKNEKTGKYTINDSPTVVEANEELNVWINNSKGVVIGQMKKIQVGQKFKIEFTESKPTDKGNDAKIIKVYPGTVDGQPSMDEEWVKSKETEYSEEEKAQGEYDGV